MENWKANYVSKLLNQSFSSKLTGYKKYMNDPFFFIMDKIVIPFLILLVIFCIFIFGLVVYQEIETQKNCGKWEYKIVHQSAYTNYIFTGKVMIPMYHPAGDYYKNVCVQPK